MNHTSPVTLRPIGEISDADADRLVIILNEDNALRQWLGMENASPLTRDEFRRTAEEWQKTKHALTFAIYTQDLIIGSISLSHIQSDGTARIGYWIASAFWRQGIGAAAFALLVEKARRLGLRQVSATIQADNIASLRIWQQWGAEQEFLTEKRVRVTLKI